MALRSAGRGGKSCSGDSRERRAKGRATGTARPEGASALGGEACACGSGLGELAKPGRAQGTRDALAAAHTLTCVCCTPGCVALVDLQAARTAARAAARSTFAPGDGCAGRDCCATRGARFQPGRFRARQQGMAAAVKDGKRKLLRWPASIDVERAWIQQAGAAAAAIAAALDALEAPTPPRRHRHLCSLLFVQRSERRFEFRPLAALCDTLRGFILSP